MRRGFVISLGLLVCLAGRSQASDYDVDAAHTGVQFKISHLGLSWVYGRFNNVSGKFTIDADNPAKTAFALSIKADSVDTGNQMRDTHLQSPDFFNAKQFPQISFKSTSVKPIEGGYDVTGEFLLHGVTKTITFPLKGGKSAEFPQGVTRTGFTTELTIKRSQFGMDKMLQAIGDDVHISISFEGTVSK